MVSAVSNVQVRVRVEDFLRSHKSSRCSIPKNKLLARSAKLVMLRCKYMNSQNEPTSQTRHRYMAILFSARMWWQSCRHRGLRRVLTIWLKVDSAGHRIRRRDASLSRNLMATFGKLRRLVLGPRFLCKSAPGVVPCLNAAKHKTQACFSPPRRRGFLGLLRSVTRVYTFKLFVDSMQNVFLFQLTL